MLETILMNHKVENGMVSQIRIHFEVVFNEILSIVHREMIVHVHPDIRLGFRETCSVKLELLLIPLNSPTRDEDRELATDKRHREPE